MSNSFARPDVDVPYRRMADSAHNAYQREYFARADGGNVRLHPTESAYVRRHLQRTLAFGEIRRGHRVLEVGAGMGRFSCLLADAGMDVVASDLSPALLAQLSARRPDIHTVASDIAEVAQKAGGGFDRVVGFFMLHHLEDLDAVFAQLRQALVPGGELVFCEPTAYCGLYYLQIALSRQMTWRGDGGVMRMRPSVVLGSMARAGFTALRSERYGFTPPALYNASLGKRLDAALESIPALEPFRAFQLFAGRSPG